MRPQRLSHGGFGQFVGALPWWVWCPCDRTVASEWCSLDKCKCQERTSTRTRSRAEHREPRHSRRIGAKVVFCMIKSYKVLFRANLPNLHPAFLGSTAPGPAAKQTLNPPQFALKSNIKKAFNWKILFEHNMFAEREYYDRLTAGYNENSSNKEKYEQCAPVFINTI